MKFCLSSRQTKEYLNKADEIKVAYRDRASIIDIPRDYPDKTIILDCFGAEKIDWKEIEQYNKLAKENFILRVARIDDLREAMARGIKRYFGYPVSSFFELNSLGTFGVEYVLLDNELFFNIQKVKRLGFKVRAVPNVAYNDRLPHFDGVCGTWIRPEDLEPLYGELIDAVEFEDCDREKEQALYRVYAEQKEWRQDLALLITNLDYSGTNRMIPKDSLKPRVDCGNRCQSGGACHLCYRVLDLANPDKIKAYAEKMNIEY